MVNPKMLLGILAILLLICAPLTACEKDEFDDAGPEMTHESQSSPAATIGPAEGPADEPVESPGFPERTREPATPEPGPTLTGEPRPTRAPGVANPTRKPTIGQTPKPTDAIATPAATHAALDCAGIKGEDWIWNEQAGQCIRETDGTWLWQGFHHEWTDTSHRFRDLHSEFYDIEYDFDAETGKSNLSGEFRGSQPVGTCEDELRFRSRKKGIVTAVADFEYGTLGPVTIRGNVDEWVEETFSMEVPLGKLARYGDNVAIFMRGFEFEEVGSASDGGTGAYPIRGLGLKVSGMAISGDTMGLTLTVALHPAAKPLNTSPTPDPWAYEVTYYYTLAGGEPDEFSFATGHGDYHGPHINADSGECPNAAAPDRQLTIQGEGKQKYNEGVVAFRGFFFKINDDTSGLSGAPLQYPGRLIRAIEATVAGQSCDWSSGEATITQNLYFCNHSVAQHAVNTYYHGFYTLLQFDDPDHWIGTGVLNDAGGGANIATVDDDDGYEWSVTLDDLGE